MATKERHPTWADGWVKGKCGCGARLVKVDGYGGEVVVCSASAWAVEKCPRNK